MLLFVFLLKASALFICQHVSFCDFAKVLRGTLQDPPLRPTHKGTFLDHAIPMNMAGEVMCTLQIGGKPGS